MPTWTKEVVNLSVTGASLTIDDIKIDDANIGHTDDTDLLALASGALTVNGTITSTGTITGTLATNAQTNVTSIGTLTTLTVDNVIINGTTIGHTGDTDLLTLTAGNLAIAGTTSSSGLITATSGVKLGNNIIYASDGGQTITLDTDDNVTVLGDLTVTGGKLLFGNGEILSNEVDGVLQLTTYGGEQAFVLALQGTNTFDTSIRFYEGASLRWSIGQDASDDTDYSLCFDFGTATVGGATKMDLDSSGNLEILGDLTISGGNITNAIIFDSTVETASTTQLNGALTSGSDGTGHDVKFFGDISGNYMLWDQSEDRLEIRNTYAKAGLLLSNTSASSTNSPAIAYYRNSASADAGDTLGITTYTGRNDANDADVIYGRLQSHILNATKGAEEGRFSIGVITNGTFRQEALQLFGQSDGTVDAAIGYGAGSLTTIAGDLAITGGNITNATTFDSTVTVGADTDGHDVKFFGNTTGNYMLWDESADTLKVRGAGVNITQLDGGNYSPKLNFYNYDVHNSSSEGMSNINFYNSKSDSETNAETDADAHLGRIVWHASTDSAFKYASTINCRQTSAYGSGNYVGSELKFTTHAQQADGSTDSTSLSWAPPATPAADNRANLIINGSSANITQASANQLYIKNGVAPGTVMNEYIAIGSKNIGSNTALELTQEEAVATEAIAAADRSVKITINGATYKLMLEAV